MQNVKYFLLSKKAHGHTLLRTFFFLLDLRDKINNHIIGNVMHLKKDQQP